MIDIRNVSKSYTKGQVKAVDDLTLTVRPGEIFGFLGPNGAGKTTTIKLIVGLLRPDTGTIAVAGWDNQRDPLQAKAVTTYVPDTPDDLRAPDRAGIPQLHRRRLRRAQGRPPRAHPRNGWRSSSWPRPSPRPSRATPTA